MKLVCTSCKTDLTNTAGSTRFKCPKCGKVDITRCYHCKELGTRYVCGSCGFEGPN